MEHRRIQVGSQYYHEKNTRYILVTNTRTGCSAGSAQPYIPMLLKTFKRQVELRSGAVYHVIIAEKLRQRFRKCSPITIRERFLWHQDRAIIHIPTTILYIISTILRLPGTPHNICR